MSNMKSGKNNKKRTRIFFNNKVWYFFFGFSYVVFINTFWNLSINGTKYTYIQLHTSVFSAFRVQSWFTDYFILTHTKKKRNVWLTHVALFWFLVTYSLTCCYPNRVWETCVWVCVRALQKFVFVITLLRLILLLHKQYFIC